MWDRRPHFVMHLGDVVDNGPDKKEWVEELFRPSAELLSRVPVFPCIGNHEKNDPKYYQYFSLPAPKYYYQYSYGSADFFVVDTNKSVRPNSEQYQWLDRALVAPRWRNGSSFIIITPPTPPTTMTTETPGKGHPRTET